MIITLEEYYKAEDKIIQRAPKNVSWGEIMTYYVWAVKRNIHK